MTDNHQDKPDMLDAAVQSLRDVPVPDGPPPELVASTLEAIRTSTLTPEQLRLQERKSRMFRIARYSGLTAATIAFATVLGWLTFTGNSSNVAFGDVIAKVKEAKSVQVVCKQKFGTQPEMDFLWTIEGDHVRMEIPNQVIVVADLKKRRSVQFDPTRKIAYKSTIPKKAALPFNNILYQLRNLSPKGAKRGEDEKIDGKTALVYEFDDLSKNKFLGLQGGEGLMKIWVDPKSKLPVKIVIKIKGNGKVENGNPFDTKLTFEKFEWNKKLGPSLFSLEIPKGYTVKNGPLGPNN